MKYFILGFSALPEGGVEHNADGIPGFEQMECMKVDGEDFRIWFAGAELLRSVSPGGDIALVSDSLRLTAEFPKRAESFDGTIAYFDAGTRRLIVPRNRAGVNHVYFSETRWGTIFSNRMEWICRFIRPTISPTGIYHFLNMMYIPHPETIFANVKKLGPGEGLRIERTQPASLFQVTDIAFPENHRPGKESLAEELREKIRASVEGMAGEVSGRRIGAYLSGGTDSSSVAGFLKGRGEDALPVFHAAFQQKEEDESEYAKIVSRRFGLDLNVRTVTPESFLEVYDRLLPEFDEPYANPSVVASQMCGDMAVEKGVHVLFAGDGGDEIFGGNERYRKDEIFDLYARLPSAIDDLFRFAVAPMGNRRFPERVRNFIFRSRLVNPDRFYSDDEFASAHYMEMLTEKFRGIVGTHDSLDLLRYIYKESDAESSINRLLSLDLKTTIADNDLVKTGIVGYHSGLWMRYPLLGTELVDFMGGVPSRWKVNRLEKRVLFKRAMKGFLPDAILKKKKHGMGIPMGHWINNVPWFRRRVLDVVYQGTFTTGGWIEKNFLEKIVEKTKAGIWDFGNEIWRVYSLNRWIDHHIAQ